MTLTLGLLVVYAVLQVGVGLWIGRRVRGAGDFFVAGRQLGGGLLATTLVAANIGAGSTVGAAGLGYQDGLSAWWWVGSAAFGSLALGLTVGPRIWSIAQQHDLRTVGDYLEHRYHRSVRGLIALLLCFGTLAIMAGQLIALAWILNVVAGVPKATGCVIGGAVATAYFAAGGLLTSAWVNLLQLGIKLAGFAAVFALGPAALGGWAEVVARTESAGGAYWSPVSNGATGWMFLPLLAPAFVISPGLLQKVYGARSAGAVRAGVLVNAAVLLVFAFVPPLLGSLARALHPGLANRELALPTLFVSDLPPAIGALGLAAVVSAEVSAVDAILFMLSTSLSQDLYRRFLRPSASEAELLRFARLAALAGAASGIGLAILLPHVIGALSVFYSVLTVSLFVPIVAGLYVPSAGTREALLAIIVGVATLLAVQAVTGGRGFGVVSPVLAGLIAASVACALGLRLRRPRAASKERR